MIIKDCIYGIVEISELCKAFIDVPEFQKLRRIKQLSVCYYVYPTATHTRFEHSVGVMFMAGKFVDQIRKFVNIDERTKQLIQLGGLYHDIGHTAFSHLFDYFLEKNKENIPSDPIFKFKTHEQRSIAILKNVNRRLKQLSDTEVEFVSNVILGKIPSDLEGIINYLFQIVCNKQSGLDVDRMDYLQRDAYHLGLMKFDPEYIISQTIIDQKSSNIAFKSKIKGDIEDLLQMRKRMFEKVYKHHSANKLSKIYYCCMKKINMKELDYIDDYLIESLMRKQNPQLFNEIDSRNIEHSCENCKEFDYEKDNKSENVNIIYF